MANQGHPAYKKKKILNIDHKILCERLNTHQICYEKYETKTNIKSISSHDRMDFKTKENSPLPLSLQYNAMFRIDISKVH